MSIKRFLSTALIGSLLALSPQAKSKERFFLPEPGFVRAKDLPDDFQARVDSIIFERKDAFEGATAYSKVDRWVFGLGNKIHVESRPSTIARRLQFEKGGAINKGILTETERVLRSEDFLSDAILEVGPDRGGLRNIKITTYDQWTTMAGGSLANTDLKLGDLFLGRWDKLKGGEWTWWTGAWESNLFGTGTKFGGSYRHELQRNVTELRLSNNSITPYNLQTGLYGAWLSDGHSLQLKVGKPILSRSDRYAFSTAFSSLQLSELLYFDANRLDDLPEKLADSLAGESHILMEYERVTMDSVYLTATRSFGSRLKFNVGPTFLFQDRYQDGGASIPDSALAAALPVPASALSPEVRTEALVGAAVSLYEYDYKTARNFRNLKWNETVETGWRLTAKAAHNQEWLGASNSDFWLAQEAVFGQAWRDTWFASCSLSTQYFLTSSGNVEDGRMDASMESQWKELPITSTYLAASWSHYFASPQSRQLVLGASEGLSGYPSFYFSGQARFLALAEQRLFPEFELATGVFAFSAYVAAGNTFPSYRDFDPSSLHYTTGLGIRVGKSKSTTKGVQHFNLSFPLGEKHLSGFAFSALAKKSL